MVLLLSRRGSLSKIDASNSQADSSQTARVIHSRRGDIFRKIRFWLSAWEIYPILFVAAFLRFYQINTTEFDADQAMIFRMAHDAIYHGLLPATSNIASIRIVNPPAVIYLLMLPAAFSANPLWGTIFVALFNVIAVLLTYFFVHCYYGRLAAIIASLLYATAAMPIDFSRFIWQQNLIAPFVVLFMFALYLGVVERRKGWLFPALLLLGILIQLHETSIILCVPLLVALLLAPGTVRWRDLALGIASLLLIFLTYLLWEFSTKFADLGMLIKVSNLHAHFDTQVLTDYALFLSLYDYAPNNMHSLLYSLVTPLGWLSRILVLLVVCGFATALLGLVLRTRSSSNPSRPPSNRDFSEVDHQQPLIWTRLQAIWTEFRADPQRCGFALLLVWQIAPILILSRHSVPLYSYYLLMLMPGPFILIGLFLSKVVHWLQRRGRQWNIPRYGVYIFVCFIIIAQLVSSTVQLTDQASGNIPHGYSYNTLNSLQDALAEADQLALDRHLNHVYIATDQFTEVTLRYLAEQTQTPTTLFDTSHCLVLPNPAAGPAVLLVGPYDKLTDALLDQFAITTLVDQPKRLGSIPFQLYIVQPIAEPKPTASNEAFVNNLQLLDNQAQHFSFDNSVLLATRWNYMRSTAPIYRTTYTYTMKALLNGNGNDGLSVTSQCVSTSMRAGDQLVITFQLPQVDTVPASVNISAAFTITMPLDLSYGPIHLESIRDQSTHPTTLQTMKGSDRISLSV